MASTLTQVPLAPDECRRQTEGDVLGSLVDGLIARDELSDYHLLHATRADLCRRLGKFPEALGSYQRALELAHQEPERRFIERRIVELKR